MGSPQPYDALREVLRLVDRMPVLGGLQRDVLSLKRTVYERRAPRFMAVGTRAVDPSALLNALLGVPALRVDDADERWVGVDAAGKRVQWARIDPSEGGAVDRFRSLCDEMVPDVLLFLVSPEEVERGLGAVTAELR